VNGLVINTLIIIGKYSWVIC